jgi:hypothetical protein
MYGVTHMDGSGEDDPPLERLPLLYDELWESGIFDGDVSVIHDDTGWCISAHRDRRVVLEHLGNGGERHMLPVSKEHVLELWRRLIQGNIEAVLSEPWIPGYSVQPKPLDPSLRRKKPDRAAAPALHSPKTIHP